MKKVIFATVLVITMLFPVVADSKEAYEDTYLSDEQVALCEMYGAQYNICPELLEALIEQESSGRSDARNNNCYGICQINGAVWGYEYDTDEKQIRQACEMLVGYNCEIDEALSHYNGQSEYHYTGYVEEVLNRAYELERAHGK